jgi:Zn-dependent oligopeptidase
LGLSLLFGESSKRKYDLDQNVVKEYLQLENLREGMFWVAGELDLQFKQITNVPVYHADVRVWEVSNKTTGKWSVFGILTRMPARETFWSLDERI